MKLTKTCKTLLISLVAAAVPAAAWAQTTVNDPLGLRRAGEREFTLGASGASSTDMDESFGGGSFSYGWYATENAAWVIRQSINYANPDAGPRQWNGATRIAYDYHLTSRGAVRPFIGANFGGAYGDGVADSWAAGLEAGAKLYVQPRTFVYAMAEYGWFFRNASALDDRFRDGQFNWTVGVGFNF